MRKTDLTKAALAYVGAASLVFSTLVAGTAGAYATDPVTTGAIEATTSVKAHHSISGFVFQQQGGDLLQAPNSEKGYGVPLSGVRVYAQWIEKDGSTSPIYTTTSGTDGSFAIAMKQFVKDNGEMAKFDADPILPEGEKWRVWTVNPDTSKYQLLWSWNHSQVGPKGVVMDTAGGAANLTVSDRVTGLRFVYSERVDSTLMHLSEASDNGPKQNAGYVAGRVFWNLFELPGGRNWGTVTHFDSNKDKPVAGVTVTGSYLKDSAVQRIMTEYKRITGKTPRAGGIGIWTPKDEASMQAWIKDHIAKEGVKNWIAETATTKTDANGEYALQFKGTWGNDVSDKEKCGLVDKKMCGTLAADAKTGSWALGNKHSKHINDDWMFISIENHPGIAQTTPFYNNAFKGYADSLTSAGWPATNLVNILNHVNFALYPEYVVFDVNPYDTTDNLAKRGDTAGTTTTGLPKAWNDSTMYQIEWSAEGKVVPGGSCEKQHPSAMGDLQSCPLTVPANLERKTTYTAKLYAFAADGTRIDTPLAMDAFTAVPETKDADGDGVPDDKDKCADTPAGSAVDADGCTMAQRYKPNYTDTNTKVGQAATSEPPLFDDVTTTGVVEKIPYDNLIQNKGTAKETTGSATFAVSMADTTVKETGAVTTTPKTEGRNEVPVKVTYPDKTVDDAIAPFNATDDDGDGDGVPDSKDKCPSTPKDYQDKVTAEGCAIPTVKDFTVRGTVGKAINPVQITIVDPDKIVTDCTSTNLPLDLTANWENGTCTVSTATTPDKALNQDSLKVEVAYQGGSATSHGSVDITDKPDGDGDAVPDPEDPSNPGDGEDHCPGTPDGTKVDANGCPVAPTVGTVPDVKGETDKPIKPVEVPVYNSGKITNLVCHAEGLAAGLTIKLNQDGTACVISGTPTESKTGEIKVSVTYPDPQDPEKTKTSEPSTGKVDITKPDNGGGNTPGGNTPGGNTPGGNTPGGNTPGGNTPGGNTPGGNTPGGTTPGGTFPVPVAPENIAPNPSPELPPVAGVQEYPQPAPDMNSGNQAPLPPVAGVTETPSLVPTTPNQPKMPSTLARTGVYSVSVISTLAVLLLGLGVWFSLRSRKLDQE